MFILLVWFCGSRTGCWSRFLLPSPEIVFHSLLSMLDSGELQHHISSSMLRIVGGFLISALIAFPLALLCGVYNALLRQLWPLLEFIRHIPPLAAVPLLILWFGIGEMSKLVIIVLASFFPIFLNTLQGISQCDTGLLDVAKSFGYTKPQIVRRVIVPFALPYIITGMRLGIGYSWRSLIAAELLAASSGLGYLILSAEQLSRTDVVMAGVFVIGFLGLAMDWIFDIISVQLSPYIKDAGASNALV